jgi:hypothetical protein
VHELGAAYHGLIVSSQDEHMIKLFMQAVAGTERRGRTKAPRPGIRVVPTRSSYVQRFLWMLGASRP